MAERQCNSSIPSNSRLPLTIVSNNPKPELTNRLTDTIFEDADRAARDAFVTAIARRLAASERGKKHTQTQLHHLALPVFVGGKRCTVCVRVHYVLSRPRDHVVESFWYSCVAEALKEFPHARVLSPVVPDGAPQLQLLQAGLGKS